MTQAGIARRNAAIVRLAIDGVAPRLIAARLNTSRETVYAALRAARAAGTPIPLFSPTSGPRRVAELVVRLPRDPRLLRAAAGRRTTPGNLVRRLVAAALEDGLVRAILDDDAAPAGGVRSP